MTARQTSNFNNVTDRYLTCECCKQGQLSIAAFIVLETVRMHFNSPVSLSSGPRCKKHNRRVGGADKSEHLIIQDEDGVLLDTDAVDITVRGVTPHEVYMYLKGLPYSNLLGIGKYKTFTHVDVRGYGARW